MSFLENLDAMEMAEGHEYYTSGHKVQIDKQHIAEDGRVLAYCIDCDWEEWGNDSNYS